MGQFWRRSMRGDDRDLNREGAKTAGKTKNFTTKDTKYTERRGRGMFNRGDAEKDARLRACDAEEEEREKKLTQRRGDARTKTEERNFGHGLD